MKFADYTIVEAQVGETLDELKHEMFALCMSSGIEPTIDEFGKDWSNTRIFGIFNGDLYVCYKYYTSYEQVNLY